MLNPCTILGLLLSLTAAILAILEASVTKFVEVFLPLDNDPKDPELSCSIAGLGVYVTSYDPSCVEQPFLDLSRLPQESFSSPTTKFKLLFPAEENFVAEVLPVDDATLTALDGLIGVEGGAEQLLGSFIDKVEDTKFENCEQYMTDVEANMIPLFSILNDQFIPQAVPLVVGEGATQITAALTGISAGIAAPSNTGKNPLNVFLTGTWFAIQTALEQLQALEVTGTPCDGLATNITVDHLFLPLDAQGFGCVAAAYGATANQIPAQAFPFAHGVLSDLAAFFQASAAFLASQTLSVGAFLIGGIDLKQEPELFVPVDFPGLCQQAAPTLCDTGDVPVLTKAGLIGNFAKLAVEQGTLSAGGGSPIVVQEATAAGVLAALPTIGQGLGAYGLALQFIAIPLNNDIPSSITNDTDFIDEVFSYSGNQTVQVARYPRSFSAFYTAVALIQIGKASGDEDLATVEEIPLTPGAANFSIFFSVATAAAKATGEVAVVPLLEQLGDLYAACEAVGQPPNDCDLFWPSLFLNGAYAFSFDDSNFLQDKKTVINQAIAACEDDESDKEHISGAQVLLGFALAMYFLAVISGLLALVIKSNDHVVLVLAGCLSILAFGLNLGALLLVQAAPVYDEVGGDAEFLIPLYKEGIVVTFGLAAMFISLVAGICYLVGSCLSCRVFNKGEAADDETKEMAAAEEPMPAKAAAEDDADVKATA